MTERIQTIIELIEEKCGRLWLTHESKLRSASEEEQETIEGFLRLRDTPLGDHNERKDLSAKNWDLFLEFFETVFDEDDDDDDARRVT